MTAMVYTGGAAVNSLISLINSLGVSNLWGVVVQAREVTEAAMAAQLHEVSCLQVTCQVREFSLDGSVAEVGERSD